MPLSRSDRYLLVPAERIAVHDLDAFGRQLVAQAVGSGEVLGGAGFLAGGEGGLDLRFLARPALLEVATKNTRYVVVMEGDTEAWIAGHPQFCPEPVKVEIAGSNWGGSMIKSGYVGRGMRLEFRHPGFDGVVVTSTIRDIRLLQRAA